MTTHIRSTSNPSTPVSVLELEQALHAQLPEMEALSKNARDVYELMRHHEMAQAKAAVQLAAILAHTEATGRLPSSSWSLIKGRNSPYEYGAEDFLAIHRLGLDARAVVALGGLAAAGMWAHSQHLPGPDEVLTITLGLWHPDNRHPVVCVWPVAGGHCVGYVLSHDADSGVIVTLNPVTEERLVWQHLWPLLAHNYHLLPPARREKPVAGVTKILEAQRQEMLREEVDELFYELVEERA